MFNSVSEITKLRGLFDRKIKYGQTTSTMILAFNGRNMMKGIIRDHSALLGSVSLSAMILLGSPVAAQTVVPAEEPVASAVQEADPEGGVGDIVVTANKRAQSINSVGLTIAAISGESLAKQKVSSLADIAQVVPGLSFAPTPYSTPIYTLRGVGFYESSLAAYPTSSIYVDEVPLPFPAMSTRAIFDLERIEVLKGPQGTLFGQNSTGGAINFIAAKPTEELTAGADISYGRFNTFEGNAHISGALAPGLTARLTVSGAHSDEWQESSTRNDKLGKTSYIAGRLLLNWEASETLAFKINLNGWKDNSDPVAAQYIALFPQVPPGLTPQLNAVPFSPFNARSADWSPHNRPFARNHFYQGSFRGDWEILSDVTITSISSYARYKQRQAQDTDGISLSNLDVPINRGLIKSFNQELRIGNAGGSNFTWVVGANYEKSSVDERSSYRFPAATSSIIFGFDNDDQYANQDMRNYAFFGNAEYRLTDGLTAKAGVRYTNARREASLCTNDSGNGSIAALYTFLSRLADPTFAPLSLTDCISLNSAGVSVRAPTDQTLKENNVSWRVGVDYKASDNLLLYANLSRGYKAGSFPLVAGSLTSQYVPVVQESVLAYEGGFKAQLLDRKVSVNGAAFYYDYTDKQLRSKTVDPLFGILDELDNVPKSRIFGAELEVNARPTAGLTLSATVTYLNTKITRYSGINAGGFPDDFAGAAIPYTPKWQGGFNVDYTWELGNSRPFLGASVTARTGTTSIIGNLDKITLPPGFKSAVPREAIYDINGYATVDLRAGVDINDGRYRVMVWGKNVFNKYYWQNVVANYDTTVRYAARPATYGVTFGVKFR